MLWLAALWDGATPRWSDWFAASAGVGVTATLLLLPFYLVAPENSIFWAFKFPVLSTPQRVRHIAWEGLATLAPVWWLALAVLVAVIVAQRRCPRSRETVVALAALAALAANLLPRGVFEEYGVPFLLPLAGAVTCELARLADSWTNGKKTALTAALIATHLAAAPIVIAATGHPPREGPVFSRWLSPDAPDFDLELPLHLLQARRVVETLVPIDHPLIGPNIILAAETGRAVPRKLRMGPFSMTMDFSIEEADRLNLLTYPELYAYLSSGDLPLIAFSTRSLLNYSWSMPSFRNPPLEERRRWGEIFHRDFLIVYEGSTFWLLARRSGLPPAAGGREPGADFAVPR